MSVVYGPVPTAVIGWEDALIDRSFGDYGQMLRTPDLRLDNVDTAIVSGAAPFDHFIPKTDRGTLVYLLEGDFTLSFDGQEQQRFRQGTALGFEDGRAHRWRSDVPPSAPCVLLVSSIPSQMSVLRRLAGRFVVLPPDAEPFATTMRLAVELHRHQSQVAGATDDSVIRRCAEICLIQFVDYVRSMMIDLPDAPQGIEHDEHLLRAWAAFFSDPRRRWTVAALAKAAGIGRTAFSERFRKVFGKPPVHALTDLRLGQAMVMLRETQAPLIEIAFSSGYNSEAAFVRAFRRSYGVPPGRYRASRSAIDKA